MINDKETLNIYLKEINRIPLLTRDEENELAAKAAAGDKAAKEKIVNANLRFVVKVAKNYQNQGLDLIDLISEGNIGLLNAIERFDVSKGFHFISYAVWWIRQSILKAICEKSRMIRIPLNRCNELVQIDKARKLVACKNNEEQEVMEIGKMLGMDETHIREMMNLSREMISLDAELSGEGEKTRVVGDLLVDTSSVSPEEHAINESMKDDINQVLETLRPNEAKVLRLRYGLDGDKPMSLKEVGVVCNLTKERIRQIEKKAIVRMQHPARMDRLASYVA
ncbi:MAG: RNA polymerase sigma factor RpoD/SigA [Treponema sp.]|nr:RNA polymerase sigma factor RpoD/SigA [Treponema sp.]